MQIGLGGRVFGPPVQSRNDVTSKCEHAGARARARSMAAACFWMYARPPLSLGFMVNTTDGTYRPPCVRWPQNPSQSHGMRRASRVCGDPTAYAAPRDFALPWARRFTFASSPEETLWLEAALWR